MPYLVNREKVAKDCIRRYFEENFKRESEKPVLDFKVDKVMVDGTVNGRFSTEDGLFLFGVVVDNEGKCTRQFIHRAPS